MKIVRCYTGDDTQSHFETMDLQESTNDAGFLVTSSQVASEVSFNTWPSGRVQAWRNAPRRQYLTVLSGRMEWEVGDGTNHEFGPGDVLLAEDTNEQRHITRIIGDEPRSLMIVRLG